MKIVQDLLASRTVQCLSLRKACALTANGIEDHIRDLLQVNEDPRITVWIERRLNCLIGKTGDGARRTYAHQNEDDLKKVRDLGMKLDAEDALAQRDSCKLAARCSIVVF